MKLPLTPPKLESALSALSSDELLEKLELITSEGIGVCDSKGRYLHWDELRHRPAPERFSPEWYWFALKQSRKAASKILPFTDKKGRSMSYCLTDEVIKNLLWLSENASGNIWGDESLASENTKKRFLVNTLIEEAINSSQLEGATTTRRDAKELIRSNKTPKDVSEQMVLNNYRAMQLIRETIDQPMSIELLCEFHRQLTLDTLSEENKDKAGAFRDANDENVGVYSNDDNTLLHKPPHFSELTERMQLLCDFCNEDNSQVENYIAPPIKAIIAHFMLGYDHPFVDGNGRTARALFYWIMAKADYWLIEYISISRVIKQSPSKYRKAYLHSETDDNDLTYFIYHQLDVIQQAIEALKTYLKKKSDEGRDFIQTLDKSPLAAKLNSRQLALLHHAIQNPGAEYTFKSHQLSHCIAYQTARTDLLDLSEKYGLLNKYKVSRKEMFIAPSDLKNRLISNN